MSKVCTLVMELSTAHIKKETSEWIQEQAHCSMPEIVCYEKGEYGWLISVPENGDLFHDWSTMPHDLALVIGFVKGSECQWLMLDRDAGEYEALPSYEW